MPCAASIPFSMAVTWSFQLRPRQKQAVWGGGFAVREAILTPKINGNLETPSHRGVSREPVGAERKLQLCRVGAEALAPSVLCLGGQLPRGPRSLRPGFSIVLIPSQQRLSVVLPQIKTRRFVICALPWNICHSRCRKSSGKTCFHLLISAVRSFPLYFSDIYNEKSHCRRFGVGILLS